MEFITLTICYQTEKSMKVYKQNTEPLEFLLSKYKFDTNEIIKISTGQRYTAVLLKCGNIGVCANLGNRIDPEKNNYSNINLKNFSHRIVLNAYFSALLNYSHRSASDIDIFMIGPSSIMAPELLEYKNIKMIFGAVFNKSDDRVLKIIQEDGGTRRFLKFENKRILQREN